MFNTRQRGPLGFLPGAPAHSGLATYHPLLSPPSLIASTESVTPKGQTPHFRIEANQEVQKLAIPGLTA